MNRCIGLNLITLYRMSYVVILLPIEDIVCFLSPTNNTLKVWKLLHTTYICYGKSHVAIIVMVEITHARMPPSTSCFSWSLT